MQPDSNKKVSGKAGPIQIAFPGLVHFGIARRNSPRSARCALITLKMDSDDALPADGGI